MNKLAFVSLFFVLSLSVYAQSDDALFRRADSLHRVMFSIDTHIDTPGCINHPDDDFGVKKGQVSFDLMKQGGLDAALFNIYLGQKGRTPDSLKLATEYAIREIDLFKKYLEQNEDVAGLALSLDDLWRLKNERKSIVVLSIENGYAIGKDLSNINMFYNMGVRSMVLCHNYPNDICDASRYASNEWGGLSPFGYDVIEEMNRIGMIVDVSHAATSTLYDCLEASKVPVIASHSAVRAIKNHPRNLTDQEMKDIAAKGGLVQIATGTWCISHQPDSTVTIEHIVDHIEYAVNLIGIEHVGIGTDFDGGGGNIGFENASKVRNLTVALMKRGFSDADLRKFWGENFLRVFKQVEDYSKTFP